MKTILAVGVCAAIAVISAGCSGGSSNGNAHVEACIRRGVAYFKEIGSYPTLSSAPNSGRSAEEVARERCNRTTTAF